MTPSAIRLVFTIQFCLHSQCPGKNEGLGAATAKMSINGNTELFYSAFIIALGSGFVVPIG